MSYKSIASTLLYSLLLSNLACENLFKVELPYEDLALEFSMPTKPGYKVTLKKCHTSCHEIDTVLAAKKKDKEAWGRTIIWMQKMQGMGPLSNADREEILNYLSTYTSEKG